MTDRADELRRLAERVVAGDFVTGSEIANALVGPYASLDSLSEEWRRWWWIRDEADNALNSSVDGARRLMPSESGLEVEILLSPIGGLVRAYAKKYKPALEVRSMALGEARARAALALRVWAEMEEG